MVLILQHQLKLLEAQKRNQEVILRRKTEEVLERNSLLCPFGTEMVLIGKLLLDWLLVCPLI